MKKIFVIFIATLFFGCSNDENNEKPKCRKIQARGWDIDNGCKIILEGNITVPVKCGTYQTETEYCE